MTAIFTLNEEEIEDIRRQTADGQIYRPRFSVQVRDQQGEVVAEVVKVLYIRRKA